MGVDGQFDASEESAAGVGGLGLDVDLALGQEGDEGGDLREKRRRKKRGLIVMRSA